MPEISPPSEQTFLTRLELKNIFSCFADKNKVSFFAKAARCWALEKGVLGGKNATTFDPGGEATRAQVAQILMNISTKKIMPF